MSGYRSLHRQAVSSSDAPIWQVQTLDCKVGWMVWTAHGNGIVCGFRVEEKDATNEKKDLMDATALQLIPSFELVGSNGSNSSVQNNHGIAMGPTQVSVVRNYVGDDELAGDVVVGSIDLVGRVCIWNIPQDEINSKESIPKKKPTFEFRLPNATGTSFSICPPKNSNGSNTKYNQNILVAVGCLDGSVLLVATGVGVHSLQSNKNANNSHKNSLLEAGTIVETLGSNKNAVASRLVWCSAPHANMLLGVGRHDGSIDLFRNGKWWHKFTRHSHPVRGLAFTPDGQLLIAGSDSGKVYIWELNRNNNLALPNLPLVHHVSNAHDGWILDLISCTDSRRYVTSGMDGRIHVWTLSGDGSYSPLFSFSAQDKDDDEPGHNTPWSIHATCANNRLVAATEKGWLQVFSME